MKNPESIKNIVPKAKREIFTIGDEELTIEIVDALYGEVDGTKELLDRPYIENLTTAIYSAVKKYQTKYNPVPTLITISHSKEDITERENSSKKDMEIKKNLLNTQTPRWSLDDVFLNQSSRNQILTALTIIRNKEKIYKEWGLQKVFKNDRSVVLNFYGPSGTGKSMAAEAIANHLGKEMLLVNYSELESKYVGETPKNISQVFRHAVEKDAVIVFDEADSFLGKRLTNVSLSADYGVNVTRSVMLMEMEKYQGIIIFTTNLITNYDDAFKRRILANVEFTLPDLDARKHIWDTHIPCELPISNMVTADILAEEYKDISGADIKDMVLYAAVACIRENHSQITLSYFDTAYQYIKNRGSYTMSGIQGAEIISTTEISMEEYEKETGDNQ